MRHIAGTDIADLLAAGPCTVPGLVPGAVQGVRLARKAVLVLGADGCEPLRSRVIIGVLEELAREVVVVAGSRAHVQGLQSARISVVDFDGGPCWRNPLREARQAWELARILEAESADLVHVVGLEPAVLACLAFRLARVERAVLHLPDLGALASATRGLTRAWRAWTLRLLAARLRLPGSFLLVESEDDLAGLRAQDVAPGPRFAVLGGCGIEPDAYPVMPPAHTEMPVAAFVGPASEANGTRTLFKAFERVWARGVRLQLELMGEHPPDRTGAIAAEEWTRWSRHPGVHCSGTPADVREVWRRAEVCVWPAEGRQGLPRAVLEAAACGRALVVSDLPGGCSGFVRDGVEGLVVPAGDTAALAAALEALARDSSLRLRLGAAARLRLLQGYTEAHVREALRGACLSLLAAGRD